MFALISKQYLLGIFALGMLGCSLSDMIRDPEPSGVEVDAESIQTPEGVTAFYYGVLENEASAVKEFVNASGLLSDELRVYPSVNTTNRKFDQRILPETDQDGDESFLEQIKKLQESSTGTNVR